MSDRIVVVGAGHAAGQLVARLRAEGLTGEITLIGDEPMLPYQRPPLSKAYMAGEIGLDRVLLRNQAFYDDNQIELRASTKVARIDRAAATVELDSGEQIEYANLVLATGARARMLKLPGADLDGIHCLRTVADADAIAAGVKRGARVAVVGGGYIGLEVAAVARTAGCEVTILEAMPRLLARTTSEVMANHVADVHQRHGVDIRYDAKVTGFAGDGTVTGVVLEDGTTLAAELVVVGIGVIANDDLAAAAGLAVDDGIVVDAAGVTADPKIWAIGDCTRHPSRLYGRNLRLESVHNAMTQSRVVAANISGKSAIYDEIPWFWTDQYDFKLQSVGLPDAVDETVVRGDPASGTFTVFLLSAGRVVASESVNAMREHMDCRKLAGAQVTVSAELLANPETNLKELL